jgi:hypothetical protein
VALLATLVTGRRTVTIGSGIRLLSRIRSINGASGSMRKLVAFSSFDLDDDDEGLSRTTGESGVLEVDSTSVDGDGARKVVLPGKSEAVVVDGEGIEDVVAGAEVCDGDGAMVVATTEVDDVVARRVVVVETGSPPILNEPAP